MKWLVLIVLCVQNTSIMLSMHHVLSNPDEKNFSRASTVVCVETAKLVSSVIMFLLVEPHKSIGGGLSTLRRELTANWRSGILLIVPAFIYSFQNNVMFVALSNLDAAMAQVMYQLKILTTALLSRVLLRRKLSKLKWFSLTVLTAGVALVKLFGTTPPSSAVPQVHHAQPTEDGDALGSGDINFEPLIQPTEVPPVGSVGVAEQNQLLGILAVLLACTTSALGGVFFEKVLKGSKVSLWLRNIQLAIYGIVGALIMTFLRDGASILENGFFYGYSPWVWSLVGQGAFGGLVVALVVQYADSILKCFAVSCSIVLSSVLSMFFQDFEPNRGFVGGTALVVLASLLYCQPDRRPVEPAMNGQTSHRKAA